MVDDITSCYERGGQPEWDNNDYQRDFTWLGIRRDRMVIRKRFYVASDRIAADLPGSYTHESMEDAVNHAQRMLADNPATTAKYIVKIIAIVRRPKPPVEVELVYDHE